jgi:hypothetical protein
LFLGAGQSRLGWGRSVIFHSCSQAQDWSYYLDFCLSGSSCVEQIPSGLPIQKSDTGQSRFGRGLRSRKSGFPQTMTKMRKIKEMHFTGKKMFELKDQEQVPAGLLSESVLVFSE